MNLMIVLVPKAVDDDGVTRITVVELNLPATFAQSSGEQLKEDLEVLATQDSLEIYFPQGYLVESLPKIENDQAEVVHDYEGLQSRLKDKQALLAKGADKKDITLLLPADTDYQTIVSLIDFTRSAKT